MLLRRALGLIGRDLGRIEAALARLADRHKATPMAGRTHAVHALPITFGLKAAVWLAEVARHRERLEQLRAGLLVGNITGAVGTFAGFGAQGFAVQAETLRALGLGVPEVCWHAARDRFAEFVTWEALTASTLAKIANEVRSLMKTEVGELEEPVPPGAVGSSTMTGGLIMAEAVMFALGKHIGKQRAHDVVYECAMAAQQSGRPFAEVLAADRTVGHRLTGDEIARLLDPQAHLGLSVQAVEQVLKGRQA